MSRLQMIKRLAAVVILAAVYMVNVESVHAASDVYIVQPGDSLWEISLKYQVYLKDILDANPQFSEPDLIYPGNKVIIPLEDPSEKEIEREVVEVVNSERAKYGLKPLIINWQLSRVARYKSDEMRDKNYFGQNSPAYGSPVEMLQGFNIVFDDAGQNIARGQRTAKSVVTAWMNSEDHRKNILNPAFEEIGVGYSDGDMSYWTQVFIKR